MMMGLQLGAYCFQGEIMSTKCWLWGDEGPSPNSDRLACSVSYIRLQRLNTLSLPTGYVDN